MRQPLGRLEKIELRDIWRSEAQDFTPWLASSTNLALLGEALGIELEIEAQERNVGPFKADILCKDMLDGSWVLIENQLERTDHTHLGQLLTYAAGLQAVTIVWIAGKFTDEHRAALDWLNETTGEKFRFFGLEVELWRIADSPAAPKFNIVCQPNEWSKSVGEAARRIESDTLTETKAQQLRFWQTLHGDMANKSTLKPQKPYPQHWMNFSIGRTGFLLGALLNTREERIGVELYINHDEAKRIFKLLKQGEQQIAAELGFSPEWLELPNRSACRVVFYKYGCDPRDEARWHEYRRWMTEHLAKFEAAFRNRIRTLDIGDMIAGENAGTPAQ